MGRLLFAILIVAVLSLNFQAAPATAEWTVMIYMNAKNSLEPDALDNFAEIAGAGSTSKVNLVVEMGRPKQHLTNNSDDWSGVLRFHVKKNQRPIPAEAVLDVSASPALSDMGASTALEDFITWTAKAYPAKRYMLVIWNHGQGWRYQAAPDGNALVTAAKRSSASHGMNVVQVDNVKKLTPPVGGFRAVSFDDDTKHFLYNSDVQAIIQRTSKTLGKKLDIVSFDACLMSMLETAYGLRDSASLLVSSEELEPGAGWDYNYFLIRLLRKPAQTPIELSKAIIDGYKRRYGDYRLATLSAIDLTRVAELASDVSDMADKMTSAGEDEAAKIRNARANLVSYGVGDGLLTSVDLVAFLQAYSALTTDPAIKSAITKVRTSARRSVLVNYASSRSADEAGSAGIAIYFPETKDTFEGDPYHQGYIKTNTDHAVSFVTEERWANFLQTYLAL
ncbi:clostripain-related cysteine peptidase [Rhizobium leguminosarum]|nr:clostripain-related cysteine peptidase [Rhizobium leguminosarum]